MENKVLVIDNRAGYIKMRYASNLNSVKTNKINLQQSNFKRCYVWKENRSLLLYQAFIKYTTAGKDTLKMDLLSPDRTNVDEKKSINVYFTQHKLYYIDSLMLNWPTGFSQLVYLCSCKYLIINSKTSFYNLICIKFYWFFKKIILNLEFFYIFSFINGQNHTIFS